MNIKEYMKSVGNNAKESSISLAKASTEQKNTFLHDLSKRIISNEQEIIDANKQDLLSAEKNGLDDAFIDRLAITKNNIYVMAEGLRQVQSLNDLIGEMTDIKLMNSGIKVGKMRVPLGVIGMIYESRPNVTIDAAALAIKSGNSIVLRGGSESLISNNFLAQLINQSLKQSLLPQYAVQIIETKDREAVTELITMDSYIDVIIPRGGKSLVKKITDEATIPVIKHLDGNCHMFIDDDADINMALELVDNAKTQRLGTCNTLESLVITNSIAREFLPKIQKIFNIKKIDMRVCEESLKIIPNALMANDNDFYAEYLGPTISCKIVSHIDDAIKHINHYSSGHTESIVTNNHQNAMKFLREIDSSSVMVNTSTRFADGFEYGLGAEIGISTDKFHARGPVGLEGLTSMKYVVLGNGQIRK